MEPPVRRCSAGAGSDATRSVIAARSHTQHGRRHGSHLLDTTDNKRFCSGLAMDELDQKVSAVLCPGCILAMKEVEQKPILFSHGLCDVTFVW